MKGFDTFTKSCDSLRYNMLVNFQDQGIFFLNFRIREVLDFLWGANFAPLHCIEKYKIKITTLKSYNRSWTSSWLYLPCCIWNTCYAMLYNGVNKTVDWHELSRSGAPVTGPCGHVIMGLVGDRVKPIIVYLICMFRSIKSMWEAYSNFGES